jgi:hypothetical protein
MRTIWLTTGLLAAVALASVGCPNGGSNQAPRVILNPDVLEKSYTVGEQRVYLEVLAQDPEGDELSFDYTYRARNEQLSIKNDATFLASPGGNEAVFSWDPGPGDVTSGEDRIELIFIVTDEAGNRTERTLFLQIVPGNGEPRFENSDSLLYDDCCDTPLAFEVVVRDDDSEDVTITMPASRAPEGATFQQTSPKQASFRWKPTEMQSERRVHSVTFLADDGQHTPIEHKITILIPPGQSDGGPSIRDPDADLCAGEDAITHTPLGAQHDATAQTFPIEGELSAGAAQLYDRATLFWSLSNPLSGDSRPLSIDMTLDGRQVSGELPNALLSTPGVETIFYKICLSAGADNAQNVLCVPTASFYAFNVYRPGDSTCAEDSVDLSTTPNDSFSEATSIPFASWSHYKLCADSKDFHSVELREGQEVRLFVSYPLEHRPLVKVYDQERTQLDLVEISDCAGLTTVDVAAPVGEGDRTYYLEVVGDDIPYFVTGVEFETGGDCSDAANEPNATPGDATKLSSGQRAEDLEICPSGDDVDVYAIELQDNERLTATMLHDAATNNLDMNLFAPSQSGEVAGNKNGGVAATFSVGEDEEVLEVEAPECGTHYLQVFNNNATAASYSLEIDVAPTSCVDDDEFSCNHTRGSASLVGRNIGAYEVTLCPERDDWYRFLASPVPYTAELEVRSGGSVSDVELEAYDADGDRVATGTVDGSTLRLAHTPESNGTLFFRVSADSAIEYTIAFSD